MLSFLADLLSNIPSDLLSFDWHIRQSGLTLCLDRYIFSPDILDYIFRVERSQSDIFQICSNCHYCNHHAKGLTEINEF